MTISTSSKANFYAFIPLFLVLIIDAMGVGLVFPVLSPIYMQVDGGIVATTTLETTRNLLYGVTLAGFSFAMFFGAPLLGDLSDQLGRKKVLIICLVGTAISFFISAIGIQYKSVMLLILGRFIGGFCAGSQPIAQAAITDISTPKNKALNLSLISAAFSIGFVIGPVMGGFLSDVTINEWFNYSTPFFVAAVLSLANAFGLYLTFAETYHPVKSPAIDFFKGFKLLLSVFDRKDILLLVMVYFISEVAWTLYFQYMSLYLVHAYQFTATQIGQYMSVLGIIFVLNMLVIVPLAIRWIRLETAIFFGLLLCLIGMLASIFLRSEDMQWVLLFPINIGTGLVYTTSLALFSNAVDRDSQGWIMGVVSAVVSLAWFLTGMAIGPFASIHIITPFIVASVLLLASVIGMWIYIQQHSPK